MGAALFRPKSIFLLRKLVGKLSSLPSVWKHKHKSTESIYWHVCFQRRKSRCWIMFTSEGIVLLNSDQKEIFQNILQNHPIFPFFVVFPIEKKLWKPSLTWLLYSYTIIQYKAYLFNIWCATRWWCLKKPRRLTFTCLSKSHCQNNIQNNDIP